MIRERPRICLQTNALFATLFVLDLCIWFALLVQSRSVNWVGGGGRGRNQMLLNQINLLSVRLHNFGMRGKRLRTGLAEQFS